MFVSLNLCLFHAPLGLDLPQVYSERDTYICIFTLRSSSDTLPTPSSLYFAYYLFDWKLIPRDMKKTWVKYMWMWQ